MRLRSSLLVLTLLLASCGASVTSDEDAGSSEASVSSVASSEASSEAASSASSEMAIPPVPFDQALDGSFVSPTMGIEFRYPTTVYIDMCDEEVPVHVRETGTSAEFVMEYGFGYGCTHVPVTESEIYRGGVVSWIAARRVKSRIDAEQFITVLFPRCVIGTQEETEEETRFFLHEVSPDDLFSCGEMIVWNRGADVVYFSPLGSKTGGGVDWPSKGPVMMPEGGLEYSFDYPIMQTLRFVAE